MTHILTLAPAPRPAAWPEMPAQRTETSQRRCGLTALRSLIATWSERKRFRWELEQWSRDNSHLIDDIGLTARQVEAEIAKPFWQA